jgi:hypothetical protein
MPHTSTSSEALALTLGQGVARPHQPIWGVETACLVQHVVHELWGQPVASWFVFHLVSSQNAFACFETDPYPYVRYTVFSLHTPERILC